MYWNTWYKRPGPSFRKSGHLAGETVAKPRIYMEREGPLDSSLTAVPAKVPGVSKVPVDPPDQPSAS